MVEIVDRAIIELKAAEILSRGTMTSEQQARFLAGESPGDDVVIQSSSGSSGVPLLIPRSRNDILNIATRVWAPFVKKYQRPPARIALFGGISHSQAAMKLNLHEIKLQSFELHEIQQLIDFDPEVVSCYPSVLRELLTDCMDQLKSVKAIKLGGEYIFPADLEKVFRMLPDVIIIEQLGSTEMPALALRVFEKPGSLPAYELQKSRFSFHGLNDDGWQALIVRDDFEDRLFPIDAFYDTGDEVLLKDSKVIDIRRKNDPAFGWREQMNVLYGQGCVLLQINLQNKTILYTGNLDLPEKMEFKGQDFHMKKQKPARIPTSKKLKSVIV